MSPTPPRRSLACALWLLAWCSTTAQAQTVATGARHGLALQTDGSVLAWGDNRLAQLGSGRTLYSAVAREVTLPAKAVAVQASSTSALVLDDQGNVWSWGTNRRGELGDGTRTDRTTLQIVFRNAAQITINGGSSSPTFVIDKDGQPWWWGPMYAGGEILLPTRAAQVLARLVSVGQYGPTTAGLDDKGVVWAWGEYVPCAASTGPTGPVAVAGLPPIERFYFQLGSARPNFGAEVLFTMASAVDVDGRAWKWGAESGYGPAGMSFGFGPHTYLAPVCPPVRNPQYDVTAPYTPKAHSELVRSGTVIERFITSGSAQAQASYPFTTLGITADGELWQWREEYNAPPGMTLRHEASNVADASRYSTREREGALGLIYVTRDGKVYAKGTNYNLHLGIARAEADGTDAVSSPQKIHLPAPAVSVHANGAGSYALLKDGTLLAWGAGAGQLDRFSDIGWYSVPERPSQVAVPVPIARLAVADGAWLALDSHGGVWSSDEWGSGVPSSGLSRPTMVSHANGLPPARAISLGGRASRSGMAAILGQDGSVWTIGTSAGVAIPPGSGLNELFAQMKVPRKVVGLPPSIMQVAAMAGYGDASAYALDASGAVWFWGQHAYGIGGRSAAQVGIDLVVNVPYVLPLPQKAVSIHTNAYDHGFCAVLVDGSAQCYGRMFNEHAGMAFRLHAPIKELSIGVAELGQGSTTDSPLGTVHFRLADGTVWAWGQGRHGQLGAGSFANTTEPVPANNEAGTGDLDLDPGTPNVAAQSRPPFRVKTRLEGSLRNLSFSGDIFGGAGAPADSRVYTLAVGGAGTWVQRDAQGQWSPLRSPVPAVASGVQLDSEAQSVSLANILQQFPGAGLEGLRIYVGHGRDVDEMLSARRFREVLELAPED